MTNTEYHIGQLVNVEARLWAGINRQGGVARIIKIDRCQYGYVETVDVKYIVGPGCDTKVDLDFIQPHEDLERTSRSRRGRDMYRASPAKATTTPRPSDNSNQTKTTKRRKVSPSPGRHALASANAPDVNDLPTPTKASTVRMTLGSEQPTLSKLSSHKPPVPYIIVSSDPPNVSPLPSHIPQHSYSVKKRDSRENETQRPAQAKAETKPATNNSTTMISSGPSKKRTQSSTNPSRTSKQKANDENVQPRTCVVTRPSAAEPSDSQPSQVIVRKRPATAEMKQKLATTKSPLLHFKLPLASSRRVPLRQVFDHDMNVRQTFVNDIVGETKSASVPEVAAVEGEDGR